MQSTYYSIDDLEKIKTIIELVGDVPYEEALAAYNEIINRSSLYWGLFVFTFILYVGEIPDNIVSLYEWI